MPTKDEPIITFRASWEMKSRIADEVLRRGLRSKGEFIRSLLEEALQGSPRDSGAVTPLSPARPGESSASPRAAVEQALGDSSTAEHLRTPREGQNSKVAGSTPAPPAPAESPPWAEPEVQRYRCPRDCNPAFRPTSDAATCRHCGRKASVPV